MSLRVVRLRTVATAGCTTGRAAVCGARGAAGSALHQLRGEGGLGSAAVEAVPSAPTGRPSRVAVADRDFLLAGAVDTQQVLLHDYRDVKRLKQITAGGIFGSLMSSSGLAYAISLDWSAAACGFFALQTAGAAACLAMYLRTYVARAVLDPRRARLVLTGCGPFGEPLASEQHVPLAALRPGASRSAGHLKFGLRGAAWDPSSWLWYRMPRRAEGEELRPGAQVGHRAPAPAPAPAPAGAAPAPGAPGAAGAPRAGQRRFPGAGLGAGAAPPGVGGAEGPRAPRAAGAAEPRAAEGEGGGEGRSAAPRKSLAGLRLAQGLPADGAEEQRLLDFFEDPSAYAVTRI